MSPSQPFQDVIDLDVSNLKKRLLNQLSALLEAIFHFEFSHDDVSNENKVDKPYLQSVLATFVTFPAVSYNEVHLEYHSTNNLVGGSIEVVGGSEVKWQQALCLRAAHECCYLPGNEAKSSSKCLAASASDKASFEQATEDTKALIQPMLELTAISEVTHRYVGYRQ